MKDIDKLLVGLYGVYSPSNNEQGMVAFLEKELNNTELYGQLTIEKDSKSNIYITKNIDNEETFFPCVAAHIDQVASNGQLTNVVKVDNCYFGWCNKTHSQKGLGADDKNGIWCALKLLQKFNKLKVAFFVGEEAGCIGSSACDMNFFKDVRFVLQADRRGNTDIIYTAGGTKMASEEFKKEVNSLIDIYAYKETTGLMTDVKTLVERGVGVSCINLSCGYYNPHTSTEYTIYDDLLTCYHLMSDIIDSLEDKQYVHKYEKPSYSYSSSNCKSIFQQGNYEDDYPEYEYGGYYGYGKSKKETKKADKLTITQENKFKNINKIIEKLQKDLGVKTIEEINIRNIVNSIQFNSYQYISEADYLVALIYAMYGLKLKL